MTPEFLKKWEHVLDGVDKSITPIPPEFIKKIGDNVYWRRGYYFSGGIGEFIY